MHGSQPGSGNDSRAAAGPEQMITMAVKSGRERPSLFVNRTGPKVISQIGGGGGGSVGVRWPSPPC